MSNWTTHERLVKKVMSFKCKLHNVKIATATLLVAADLLPEFGDFERIKRLNAAGLFPPIQ